MGPAGLKQFTDGNFQRLKKNASMTAKTVLYVRLPVWKIYPGGVVYVADYVHKHRPDVHQEILDLALVDRRSCMAVLKARIQELQPDVVAFSWRNMQAFGPHPENDALDVVMNYDHSPRLWPRIRAARDAISIIYDYSANRINNFRYMKLVRRMLPRARIVVGGTAVSIFARYVAEKCPRDSVVVVGEGEDSMVSIVDGLHRPVGDYYYKDHRGKVTNAVRSQPFDLQTLTAVDFGYIRSIFPGFDEYVGEYIGVQTKRGCPYQCHFCLYNQIEGCRQRYRDPVEIAKEVETLNKTYGVRKIWFTDAQFCSTLRSTRHVDQLLGELIARKTDIQWSGYLRFNHLTPGIARKMFATGLCSIDTTFTGSQHIIDTLTLGYSLSQQMEAFRMLRAAGHTDQQVKLYIPLNAPGETVSTLRETLERIEELYELFGRDCVLPFIFFIGVQPNTPVERLLIKEGYLKAGYNPLTLNPFTIKKLLYNPPPLGRLIGRAYLKALEDLEAASDYIGRATMDNIAEELRGIDDVPAKPRRSMVIPLPFPARRKPGPRRPETRSARVAKH